MMNCMAEDIILVHAILVNLGDCQMLKTCNDPDQEQ